MTKAESSIVRPIGKQLPQLKSASREIELKFLTTKPAFKAAQQWDLFAAELPRPRARRQLSVYFDTAEGDLERNRAVLRMRTQNKRYVMTFKWNGSFSGGPFERGEVEAVSTSPAPDPALFGADVNEAIATLTQGRALQPVYTTDIKRTTHRIHSETSEIELCFDTGIIKAGEMTDTVCEIEIELKFGEPADLYNLGISLTEAFPARISCFSKAERGALLRSGNPPPVIRAKPVLEGTPTVDEAISSLINACIGQFIGNWPAFEKGDGVNAVHQIRVAMRRLRSLLGLFQRSFPSAEIVVFRSQAKAIASAMSEARNWDVFIDRIQRGPVTEFPNEPGFKKLLADAKERREAGYEAVRNLLAAADTTRFVLSIQAFVVRHGWRNTLADEVLPELIAPAEEFASVNLRRLHRKLLKRGKRLSDLSPPQRHEVRKDLKKLRYAADSFGSLFENSKQVCAYTRAVSALQDQLGMFNDLVTAQDLAARLNTGGDLASHRAEGIIIGWCGHDKTANDASLRKAWKNFRKAKLFT